MGRSLLAGVCGLLCLLILGGMLARHAYPLWVGQPVMLRVAQAGDVGEALRGDYLVVQYEISRLQLVDAGATGQPTEGVQYWSARAAAVKVVGEWLQTALRVKPAPEHDPYRPQRELERALRGKTLYVQLERKAEAAKQGMGEYAAVSVSEAPVVGAVNLRGRVRDVEMLVWSREAKRYVRTPPVVVMEYGLESLYVPEGQGALLEQRMRRAQSQIGLAAVAPSGEARLRDVLLDGKPALAQP